MPGQALIDPSAQNANFFGRQRGAFWRHQQIGIVSGDQSNEVALVTLAFDDGRTRIAAGKKLFARIHLEPAPAHSAAVALKTSLGKQGMDFHVEIHCVFGGQGERWHILRKCNTPMGYE
jgi:hypothetical protein